jgi:shikimate dehydrogenase
MAEPPNLLGLLTGSFSKPAAENPTVAMIEAACRHHGLDARYINCEVAPVDLGNAVRGARATGGACWSIRTSSASGTGRASSPIRR